jgi:thiosulfate dehydrogenase [quinone] large subunit
MFEQSTLPRATYDWETEKTAFVPRYKEAAYALLRLTLGVIFLFSGVGKLMAGVGNFEAGLETQFAGKLPLVLIKPFGYALPFAELLVGMLIVLGLFNLFALVVSGLELIVLTFGTVVAGEFPVAAHNTQYALVNFVLLWFANYNGYSLDRLTHRKKQRGFNREEY